MPVDCKRVLVGACILLAAQFGCAHNRASEPQPVQRDVTVPQEQPVAAAAPDIHIAKALQSCRDGDRDHAVRVVLELYDLGADAPAYRPFTLSSEQAVALPAAEREALLMEAVDTLRVMRHLARELLHRAQEAQRNGEDAQALRLLGAMKRLGQANRGPEVMQIVDLVGKAIEQLADKALSELIAPDTEENTRTP